MRIAVVGGGLSGAAITRAIAARGGEVQLLSRSSGFDVLRDDARAALGVVGAVIEAAGRFTLSRPRATAFFTRATTAVGTAARELGIRHVLLSIVSCDRADLQGYGYFAAKAVQERVARSVNPSVVVVRSTQWFEFAQQNATRFGFGPLVLVPSMRIQPIALDEVAGVLADVALGLRDERRVEVAGPEVMTLQRLSRAVLAGRRVVMVPAPLAGRAGAGFRGGALLPGPQAEIRGPHLREWVAHRA